MFRALAIFDACSELYIPDSNSAMKSFMAHVTNRQITVSLRTQETAFGPSGVHLLFRYIQGAKHDSGIRFNEALYELRHSTFVDVHLDNPPSLCCKKLADQNVLISFVRDRILMNM